MKPRCSSASVVRVGDGRGFLVDGEDGRLIITAAHCLPTLPPAMSISLAEEKTYLRLVGPLGRPPTLAVECLFVDRIADIAILGEPDGQELYQQWNAYGDFVSARRPLPIETPEREMTVWALGLDGGWLPCTVEHGGGSLWITGPPEGGVEGGMSGSPLVTEAGAAVGVVVTNVGPQPRLDRNLPGWLLKAFPATHKRRILRKPSKWRQRNARHRRARRID